MKTTGGVWYLVVGEEQSSEYHKTNLHCFPIEVHVIFIEIHNKVCV